MKEDKITVLPANKERGFTRCYHDFIDCSLLNGEEKAVFMILKRFMDIRTDQGEVFPSIGTIQKLTGWGNKKVIRVIQSLKKKGIVTVKRRGLTKSNLYLINDKRDMWKAGTVEELQMMAEETAEEKAVRYLKSIGYTVTKEKEPDQVVKPTTATAKSGTNSNTLINNPNGKRSKCQDRKNGFHNFEQRDYDFDALEQKLTEKKD